jgi:acetyl esterase/lipase
MVRQIRVPRRPSLRSRVVYELLKRRAARPGDLQQRRAAFERLMRRLQRPLAEPPRALRVGERGAEWLNASQLGQGRAILFLHGGGYMLGSLDSHRSVAERLAVHSGCPVLSLDYRLAPEHPFPAALDDTLAAVDWLQAAGYGADGLVLAGDSAGGGLALAACLQLRDRGCPPRGVVCLSPWTDLALGGASYRERGTDDPLLSVERLRQFARDYAGGHDLRDPGLSPVYGDLRGLPPTLIQVGEHELLLSDAQDFAQHAVLQGSPVTVQVWPGLWHVWQAMPCLPESAAALQDIGAFVRQLFAGEAPRATAPATNP